jgi:hypothetical protein
VRIWHLSAPVLITVFIHNVARIFYFVHCGVNGICGDLLGRWHFSSDRAHSDILANSFRDRQYSAATEVSLHCGIKKS